MLTKFGSVVGCSENDESMTGKKLMDCALLCRIIVSVLILISLVFLIVNLQSMSGRKSMVISSPNWMQPTLNEL